MAFLLIGACSMAVVFGGIAVEMSKALDENKQKDQKLYFVIYSLQIHHFPSSLRHDCCQYLLISNESDDIRPYHAINEFFDIFNPKMLKDLKHNIYFDQLHRMSLFKQAGYTQIMSIADLMRPKLFIPLEEIITQGDEASQMYVIFRGTVCVFFNCSYSQKHSEDLM